MKLFKKIKENIKENMKKEINKSQEDFDTSTILHVASGITFVLGFYSIIGNCIEYNIKIGTFLAIGSIILLIAGNKIKKNHWKDED